MINEQLLRPKSIVVIGGSNNVHKPGGSIVRNLINGDYHGELRIVNPKEDAIQGIKAFHDVKEIPQTDLAILVVAAKYCPDYVDYLCAEKGVRAFVIISAGFGEETKAGAALEQHILDTCEKYGAALIGPNCIGLLNRHHHSVFTLPIPKLDPKGADFISGSGATAVFILESAVIKGLQFNSVWSIGNGKQIGIEDVLQYMYDHFDPETDSKVKLLYIENISNPDKLLYYASRLIQKGCRIAAIKAGSSESGSRAASSHTGAIASSDAAVEALFRKAGIVRCFSREELTTAGCIFMVTSHLSSLTSHQSSLLNFAIVTHAGGPGVMLTDALSKGGLNVPKIEGPIADELKAQLFPGSSVANPIDFLATGTPEQLGTIIDYCEHQLDQIDAMAVIYGTPGLTQLYDAYDVLDRKIRECKKPIFPILPSMVTAGPEVADFLAKGHVNFSDEVTLATTLSQIMRTPQPATHEVELYGVDITRLHTILFRETGRLKFEGKDSGWLSPNAVREILTCAGIQMVPEMASSSKEELTAFAALVGYPVVAKVVGPIHKSDVGGVTLNIRTAEHLALEFDRMMQIPDATGVMVQKMLKGTELFIGAKYEERFGHVVLCGLGGIFVEVLKDVSSGLAPLTYPEAFSMIHSLRGYKIIKGTRGQKGLNEQKYAEIIVRLSTLLRFATKIKEIDINPLLADESNVTAVDARIRIG